MQTEIITAVNASGTFSDGDLAFQSFWDSFAATNAAQHSLFSNEISYEKSNGIITSETCTWDQSSTTLTVTREFSEPWLDIKTRWQTAGIDIDAINNAWTNAGFTVQVTHNPVMPTV